MVATRSSTAPRMSQRGDSMADVRGDTEHGVHRPGIQGVEISLTHVLEKVGGGVRT